MPEKFPSRRQFIKKAVAGGIGLYASTKLGLSDDKVKAASIPAHTTFEAQDHLYVTGPLQGHNFPSGSLFHYFTGIEGKVPPTAHINFKKQLEFLFQKKEEFVKRHHKDNTAYKQSHELLMSEYGLKPALLMDLPSYQKEVAGTITEVKNNLNWTEVQKIMNLNAEELNLLRDITQSILPKHLTAYALTEIMPSIDGVENRDVLEFLLKNAGARYVYSIPAVFDDRLSFGPYQFTSEALKDMGDNNPICASKINRALPKANQIPGSVIKLEGNHHHKAALLFAIYNLATLLKKLSSKEFEVLKSRWMKNMTAVTEFIATAHHLPAPAFTSAKRWLDGGMQQTFETSCPQSLRQYAQKTKANLSALV